jgi:hypothetical protein
MKFEKQGWLDFITMEMKTVFPYIGRESILLTPKG